MNVIIRLMQAFLWILIWNAMFFMSPIIFFRWLFTGKGVDGYFNFFINTLDNIENYKGE